MIFVGKLPAQIKSRWALVASHKGGGYYILAIKQKRSSLWTIKRNQKLLNKRLGVRGVRFHLRRVELKVL